MAVSPGGNTLAMGSQDNAVGLWDVASREPLGPPLGRHEASVGAVAFSPDGAFIAAGSGEGSLILWDTRKEPQLAAAARMANRNLTSSEWLRFVGANEPYRQTFPALPPGR
jgi:WD40 repeat protein